MNLPTDTYQLWDVPYVFGSLSPSERRIYEQHLAECPACDAAVASLAGMPGLLSLLPRESAVTLLDPPEEDDTRPPAELVRNLQRASRSARQRARFGVAAAVVTAALVGGAVVWRVQPAAAPPPSTRLDSVRTAAAPSDSPMTQTVPSPVTARIALIRKPWGTRIEVTCDHAGPASGAGTPKVAYDLYVEHGQGARRTKVATWTGGPGTTTRPVATVEIPPDRIDGVQIRLRDKDLVLLESRF